MKDKLYATFQSSVYQGGILTAVAVFTAITAICTIVVASKR